METHLRRTLGVAELMALALTALLTARATGLLAESAISRGTLALAIAAPPGGMASASASTPSLGKSAEGIVARNVFCSTCSPAHASAPDLGPIPTTLPLRLVVTMVAALPQHRDHSLALIQDAERRRIGTYGVGTKVRDATVVDIQATRVHLLHAGRPEYLDLLGEPPPAERVVVAPPRMDPVPNGLAKGIKRVREREYEVQRATLDSVLGNVAMLAQGVRILPEVRDGAAVGFRLLDIKAEGPFAVMGFESGDVIRTINGLQLSTPDLALQAYTKLKTASHLSVDIERKGRRSSLDYTIR